MSFNQFTKQPSINDFKSLDQSCIVTRTDIYCPSHGVILAGGVEKLYRFALEQEKRIKELEGKLREKSL